MKLQISHLGTAEQIITKNILTLFLFDPTWFKRSILSLLLICRRSNLLKDMNGVTKMPYSYLSENSSVGIFLTFLFSFFVPINALKGWLLLWCLVYLILSWAESEPSPQLKSSCLNLMEALLASSTNRTLDQSQSSYDSRPFDPTTDEVENMLQLTNENQDLGSLSFCSTSSTNQNWRMLFKSLLPGILRWPLTTNV